MHIHRKFYFNFFSWSYAFFELGNLAKMKDTTETDCRRNFSETAQQNFLKLCSYEGHNVQICIFTGNADLIFLRSNLYPFWTLAKIFLSNSDETAFLSNCPSLILGFDINCIQPSQAMLERWVCELAHSFFFLTVYITRYSLGRCKPGVEKGHAVGDIPINPQLIHQLNLICQGLPNA